MLENIPRILPENISVEIQRGTWQELPIFGIMQKLGNVDEKEMFRTFNMGIGMIVICGGASKSSIISQIGSCFEIGNVADGPKGVKIF